MGGRVCVCGVVSCPRRIRWRLTCAENCRCCFCCCLFLLLSLLFIIFFHNILPSPVLTLTTHTHISRDLHYFFSTLTPPFIFDLLKYQKIRLFHHQHFHQQRFHSCSALFSLLTFHLSTVLFWILPTHTHTCEKIWWHSNLSNVLIYSSDRHFTCTKLCMTHRALFLLLSFSASTWRLLRNNCFLFFRSFP